MSGQHAKVSSIETLESFAVNLSQFADESTSLLDSLNTEMQRRVNYLQFDLKNHWKRELEKGREKLSEGDRNLRTATTPSGRLIAEQIRREAKDKIKVSEYKLLKINEWLRTLNHELPIYQSRLLKLKTFIVNDLDKGKFLLKEYCQILQKYTEIGKDLPK